MSTYITLTDTDEISIHIKKSAIIFVADPAPLKTWFGKPAPTTRPVGTTIFFESGRLNVTETYTEVVKMLR